MLAWVRCANKFVLRSATETARKQCLAQQIVNQRDKSAKRHFQRKRCAGIRC
jgi:uncharacterized protein (DUF1778 family)